MKVEVCQRHRFENGEERSCINCGCYFHPSSAIHGMKTERFCDPYLVNGSAFLRTLQQRANSFVLMEPLKLNPIVGEVLDQLVEKFNLSLTTFAKAQYMFYHLLRERPQYQYQQLRYGTVCLYLAAKMTESQSHLPGIRNFGKHACRVFEQAEYETLEEEVFEYAHDKIFEIGFFVEFLQYYQVKGVVLSNERQPGLREIEQKIHAAAKEAIRDGSFMNYPQEKLAALILHRTRQELKVLEVWNDHIEFYTKIGTLEIYNILKDSRKKTVSNINSDKRIVVQQQQQQQHLQHQHSASTTGQVLGGNRTIRLPSTMSRSSSVRNVLHSIRGISVLV